MRSFSQFWSDRSLTVGSAAIQTTSTIRNLGVLLDDEVSMKQHVNKVSATCFYQHTSSSSSSRTWCHFAAGDGFCHLPARLLQLGASSSSVVHSTPTTAGTEYCSTVGVWTAALWSRNASSHSTTLVACIRWRIYYKLLYFNAHSTHSTLDAALRIWPTSSRRLYNDKPEADCDQLTLRTILHHVFVLSSASARFPTQDQQLGTVYLPIYEE